LSHNEIEQDSILPKQEASSKTRRQTCRNPRNKGGSPRVSTIMQNAITNYSPAKISALFSSVSSDLVQLNTFSLLPGNCTQGSDQNCNRSKKNIGERHFARGFNLCCLF